MCVLWIEELILREAEKKRIWVLWKSPYRSSTQCVRDHFRQQIMENAEINNIIKIVGLQYKKSYEDPESLRSLRYGKIMIMTDQVDGLMDTQSSGSTACGTIPQCVVCSQDQDGSHIKGLLINFFHHNWPSLLKHTFLEEFITPIVKVRKTNRNTPTARSLGKSGWFSYQT